MASLCPKCGRKLKLTDLKPQCPGCGTNLLYYKIEERLETDALNAEIEHAHTQKKLDRAKAAMVGSPLAIARLVLYVLIVAAFCRTVCIIRAYIQLPFLLTERFQPQHHILGNRPCGFRRFNICI